MLGGVAGLGTVVFALAIGPLTQLMLPAWIVELPGALARRVAISVEASEATITSTVVKRSSVSHSSRRRVDPAVGDRRPHLARGEVVEHDDAAALDEVGDRVDPDLGGLAGVEEQQRVGTLVEQRRPVRGEHLDQRVVGEDLRGRLREPGVELGGDDPGLLAAYAGAQPGRCRRRSRCRTRPSSRPGSRPASRAAGRSRCGRRRRSRPADRRRTPGSTISGSSGR